MIAKELRLGNIIEFEGELCRVKEIDHQGVKVEFLKKDETIWIDLFQLNEVTLTKEILLKVKGVHEQSNKIFSSYYSLKVKRDIHFLITDIGTPNFIIGLTQLGLDEKPEDVVSLWNWDYDNDIKLHQFQNLYFALTNQELEINL